jgi:hypothetical protein
VQAGLRLDSLRRQLTKLEGTCVGAQPALIAEVMHIADSTTRYRAGTLLVRMGSECARLRVAEAQAWRLQERYSRLTEARNRLAALAETGAPPRGTYQVQSLQHEQQLITTALDSLENTRIDATQRYDQAGSTLGQATGQIRHGRLFEPARSAAPDSMPVAQ